MGIRLDGERGKVAAWWWMGMPFHFCDKNWVKLMCLHSGKDRSGSARAHKHTHKSVCQTQSVWTGGGKRGISAFTK